MRAVLVVVADILREKSLQMVFVHCDDVIQQFATTTAYPAGRVPRVIPPTSISWSLGNGLLLASQPSNGAALAKVTPPASF
jgi:hypothetical protein